MADQVCFLGKSLCNKSIKCEISTFEDQLETSGRAAECHFECCIDQYSSSTIPVLSRTLETNALAEIDLTQ